MKPFKTNYTTTSEFLNAVGEDEFLNSIGSKPLRADGDRVFDAGIEALSAIQPPKLTSDEQLKRCLAILEEWRAIYLEKAPKEKEPDQSHDYKLRAECLLDVTELMKLINFTRISITSNFLPDVIFEFSSLHSLNEIKMRIARITDSHVMLETVALESNYTGERVKTYGNLQ